MFQDMNKMLEESMAPFRQMVDIQAKMLERLTRHQIECTHSCMQATLQQVMALQKATNPQQLAEMQLDYTRKLEEMLAAANKQNVKTFQEAHSAIQALTENTMDSFKAKP